MTTALEVISILPATRQQVDTFKEMLKKEILASTDPLTVLVNLKFIEKIFAYVLTDDDLDSHYLKAFNAEAKDNKLTINMVNITSQEFGSKYDYSGNATWTELDGKIKKLTEQKKKVEELLKSDAIKTAGKVKVVIKL